jgi:hypothetical protein
MNIDENKRVRASESEGGDRDETDNSWSGMKP